VIRTTKRIMTLILIRIVAICEWSAVRRGGEHVSIAAVLPWKLAVPGSAVVPLPAAAHQTFLRQVFGLVVHL
jgi:hypothetical protein